MTTEICVLARTRACTHHEDAYHHGASLAGFAASMLTHVAGIVHPALAMVSLVGFPSSVILMRKNPAFAKAAVLLPFVPP